MRRAKRSDPGCRLVLTSRFRTIPRDPTRPYSMGCRFRRKTMHPTLLARRIRRALLTSFVLLGALAPSSLFAQATTPSAVRTTTGDDTVSLSPFIVTTEQGAGWSANDTLSATRTKQLLKDV